MSGGVRLTKVRFLALETISGWTAKIIVNQGTNVPGNCPQKISKTQQEPAWRLCVILAHISPSRKRKHIHIKQMR